MPKVEVMDKFSDEGASEPVWQETGPGMNVEQLQIGKWIRFTSSYEGNLQQKFGKKAVTSSLRGKLVT